MQDSNESLRGAMQSTIDHFKSKEGKPEDCQHEAGPRIADTEDALRKAGEAIGINQ